jgi:hypothetical protein
VASALPDAAPPLVAVRDVARTFGRVAGREITAMPDRERLVLRRFTVTPDPYLT